MNEIDEQFERKVGDLNTLLIDKVFELVNGKTSQEGEEYDLYHHLMQLRNKAYLQEHVLSCKYLQLDVGNESG